MQNFIINNEMFNQADYDYLSNKGYSDLEIKNIWDRDLKLGKTPSQPIRSFWSK